MNAHQLEEIVGERRRELMLEAARERLAAPARARRVRGRRRMSFAVGLGQLLATRREALLR